MQTKIKNWAVLPFCGTYGTYYDLCQVIPNCEMSDEDVEEFWSNHDFKEWLDELGKIYTSAFEAELHWLVSSRQTDDEEEIPKDLDLMVFESTYYPREYNFSTDKIFVVLSDRLIAILIGYAWEHSKEFAEFLTKEFSDRSGFMSYYSNRLSDWLSKEPAEYDQVELGAFLDFYIKENEDEIFESILDYVQCNSSLLSI